MDVYEPYLIQLGFLQGLLAVGSQHGERMNTSCSPRLL